MSSFRLNFHLLPIFMLASSEDYGKTLQACLSLVQISHELAQFLCCSGYLCFAFVENELCQKKTYLGFVTR